MTESIKRERFPFQIVEDIPNLPMEFTREPTKHLIYHLWPNTKNGRWKWNLAQLLQRIEMFDGMRIIGVAVDENTATVQEVARFIGTHHIDYFYEVKNDPIVGEGASFHGMLKLLPHGNDDVTFYAHGKSCRHDATHAPGIKVWTETLYRACLDYWPVVRDQLQVYKVTGAFLNTGQFNMDLHDQYAFDGNFWWMRNSHAFNRPSWKTLVRMFISIESWPSAVFSVEEAGYLLFKYHERGDWLYKRSTWVQLQPLLAERGIDIIIPPAA